MSKKERKRIATSMVRSMMVRYLQERLILRNGRVVVIMITIGSEMSSTVAIVCFTLC